MLSIVLSTHVERTGPDFPVEKQLSAGKLLPQDTGSKRTGPDIKDTEKLQSAGKLPSERQPQGSGSSRRTGPDIKVAAKHQLAGKPHHSTTGRSGPDKLVPRQQSTGKPSTDLPSTDLSLQPRPSSLTGSSSPTVHKSARRDSISSVESATESELSDQPPVELFVEEGELSDNPELELEQTVSEEQTYRETMRGIRSYMGWSHVPDVDSSNPSDDNPFARPKAPAPSKVSRCPLRSGFAGNCLN